MVLKALLNGEIQPHLFHSRPLIEGVVFSSGILPGGQFDYVVPINSSGQWGTYWVHAHSSVNYLQK